MNSGGSSSGQGRNRHSNENRTFETGRPTTSNSHALSSQRNNTQSNREPDQGRGQK